MPLTYAQLSVQCADESFIQRVQEALLQDVNNGTTRMAAIPVAASDVTATGYSDRLARKIVADPHTWAVLFARLVALNLIAETNLLDPVSCTDAEIFSAVGAIYPRFYGT